MKHIETREVTTFHSLWASYEDSMPDNLSASIEWLQNKLKEIPEEFRSTAKIYLDAENNSVEAYPFIRISYRRRETDQERDERIKELEATQISARDEELKLLNHLLKKYIHNVEKEIK